MVWAATLVPRSRRAWAAFAALAFVAGAAAGFGGARIARPADGFTLSNVGGGRVVRLNRNTGDMVLFDADCMTSLKGAPAPPSGFVSDCSDEWDRFAPVAPEERK